MAFTEDDEIVKRVWDKKVVFKDGIFEYLMLRSRKEIHFDKSKCSSAAVGVIQYVGLRYIQAYVANALTWVEKVHFQKYIQ